MQLDEFLYNLHFDIDAVRPVDAHVDWDDAPLPFKLYRDLRAVTLPVPAWTSHKEPASSSRERVGLQDLSNLLWISYGLTQLCQTIFPLGEDEGSPSIVQMLRRFVPSGGALYPSELYVYLNMDGLNRGIYHYDAAHHRLVLLREGDFGEYLKRALGDRCQLSACTGTLFVSTMFWKNFYKYNNFSYRLQGLDAGALIGQILEVCKQMGLRTAVFFQFLDEAVNHLLGLRDAEERVYAVIPLATAEQGTPQISERVNPETAAALHSELPALHHRHYMKSKHVQDYPMIRQLNDAALLRSTDAFAQLPTFAADGDVRSGLTLPLPAESLPQAAFPEACRSRFSPGQDFVPREVSLEQLSTVLRGTVQSSAYQSDLTGTANLSSPRITVAACVHDIDGIADGAYFYDAKAHALRLVNAGDHRMALQLGMTMPTVNLFQVPVCFHLIGRPEVYLNTFGYRGYRMLQMEVGALLQRLLLKLSALGLAGHPLLGYEEAVCDDIYRLGTDGLTCLIQIPAGHYRKTARFEGMLFG